MTASAIAALLRERVGYVQRGLDGRVAAVDAELRRLGYKPTSAQRANSAVETAVSTDVVESAAEVRRRAR